MQRLPWEVPRLRAEIDQRGIRIDSGMEYWAEVSGACH